MNVFTVKTILIIFALQALKTTKRIQIPSKTRELPNRLNLFSGWVVHSLKT